MEIRHYLFIVLGVLITLIGMFLVGLSSFIFLIGDQQTKIFIAPITVSYLLLFLLGPSILLLEKRKSAH